MHIVSREVRQIVVDQIQITPDEWDAERAGKVTWRAHMAALLNQRAKKLAPVSNPSEFYHGMLRFARSLGFGSVQTIIEVAERIYNVELLFTQQEIDDMQMSIDNRVEGEQDSEAA